MTKPSKTKTALTPLNIQKTIKLFIGGTFPRTESGRSYAQTDAKGNHLAQLCRASRKDLRNAVGAAKKSQSAWEERSAYNRSQILYRMAEMTQSRRLELIQLLENGFGFDSKTAEKQIEQGINAMVYYAGFCDKIQQIAGCINPVASPHHNFTTVEPVGVVGYIAEEKLNFGKLIEEICATLSIGNSIVVLLGQSYGALLAPLAEIFSTSDLPAGVINLLTGYRSELAIHFSSHMEIHSLILPIDLKNSELKNFQQESVHNMKRVHQSPKKIQMGSEPILRTVEFKTVWHPMGF